MRLAFWNQDDSFQVSVLKRALKLGSLAFCLFLTSCIPMSGDSTESSSTSGQVNNGSGSGSPTPIPPTPVTPTPVTPTPVPSATAMPSPTPVTKVITPEQNITLDAIGESFQKSIAAELTNARYMEQTCRDVSTWQNWQDLPMKWCTYMSLGQATQVLLLDPGPRRLTMWIQDACTAFAMNLNQCMSATYSQIINQSGAQFPVAGVVVEDSNGTGRGNAYAFRNGVTVAINAFASGTVQILSPAQTAQSFTDVPIKTFSYGRPVSVTREQLTAYATAQHLTIPVLGTSADQLNIFNEEVGLLYQQAWLSSQNQLIRAWVSSQGF